jgi:hypothetical protein
MTCAAADRQTHGLRTRSSLLAWRRALSALLLACAAAWTAAAQAQPQPHGVEVLALSAKRDGESATLDYQLRVTLPHAVEEAALRGIALYFVATATVWRPRWYWRDSRVARSQREWRLSYQPLTSTWRVSQGGLGQSHDSLADALAVMTRSTGWPIADAARVEADGSQYVEFEWELDTSQLPRPLQIGLTGVGGSGDWALGVKRTVKLEAPAAPAGVIARPEPR